MGQALGFGQLGLVPEQSFLNLLAFADVAECDHRARHFSVPDDGRGAHPHRNGGAVLAPEDFAIAAVGLACAECPVNRAVAGGVGRAVGLAVMELAVGMLADELGFRPSQQPFRFRVGENDTSVGVDDVHRLGQGGGDFPQARLVLGQGAAELPAGRHGHRHEAGEQRQQRHAGRIEGEDARVPGQAGGRQLACGNQGNDLPVIFPGRQFVCARAFGTGRAGGGTLAGQQGIDGGMGEQALPGHEDAFVGGIDPRPCFGILPGESGFQPEHEAPFLAGVGAAQPVPLAVEQHGVALFRHRPPEVPDQFAAVVVDQHHALLFARAVERRRAEAQHGLVGNLDPALLDVEVQRRDIDFPLPEAQGIAEEIASGLVLQFLSGYRFRLAVDQVDPDRFHAAAVEIADLVVMAFFLGHVQKLRGQALLFFRAARVEKMLERGRPGQEPQVGGHLLEVVGQDLAGEFNFPGFLRPKRLQSYFRIDS